MTSGDFEVILLNAILISFMPLGLSDLPLAVNELRELVNLLSFVDVRFIPLMCDSSPDVIHIAIYCHITSSPGAAFQCPKVRPGDEAPRPLDAETVLPGHHFVATGSCRCTHSLRFDDATWQCVTLQVDAARVS